MYHSNNEKINIRDYSQEDYREFWEKPSNKIIDYIERKILRQNLPNSGGWFIDLGSGFGRLLPLYQCDNCNIVLVDYTINHLEMALKRCNDDKTYFIAANAYYLPFREKVFSSGLSVRLFQHINVPTVFLSELSRIFQQGAGVVFTYVNKRSLFWFVGRGFGCFKKNHEELSDLLYGTHPAYIVELLDNAGFNAKCIKGTGFVHQLAHSYSFIDRVLIKSNTLFQLTKLSEQIADNTLGKLKFAFLQYVLLEKRDNNEMSVDTGNDCKKLEDILACPKCHSQHLKKETLRYICKACGNHYPILQKKS